MEVPHSEKAFQRFLIGIQEVVIGGNAPSPVNVLQRFELGEFRLAKLLSLADQVHHFVFPLREELLPVLVVIEGALLELLCAPRNLGGIADAVAPDIDSPVDNAIVDA